ncbi:DNA-(apurinic or apyrimidinic site) lyase [Granulicatella balaenopterae]|uniref:Formamidopyrimidine-DNA glycosylase n=1 Tax=Granulicatella balaenopterae TaxID=137733 RepID=A0A1H9HSB0_9LACT|nr:DNA-formamidopyrimidine glycosylase [Granulicatella balaenopterae]SEQ65211.1 DNA-(apurinic or apyrimidinic site) lyase [Granulicatella balaenopterae]
MPELPEVETVRRGLLEMIKDQTIIDVDVYWDRIITPPFDSEKFKQSLVGETIHTILRRGKYLIFLMDHWAMISHLRMEGKYKVCPASDPLEKHTHVVFTLADGRSLRYLDVRKFGRMTLVPITMIKDKVNGLGLGPEPILQCFKLEDFYQQLQTKKQMIKPALLNQKLVAGLGNIYVDEVLFRAKIMPNRACNDLTKEEVERLHHYIIEVIEEAVAQGGSTIRSYQNSFGAPGYFQQSLRVYGHEGDPCVDCGQPIKKTKIAQRGTHYCPHCQS